MNDMTLEQAIKKQKRVMVDNALDDIYSKSLPIVLAAAEKQLQDSEDAEDWRAACHMDKDLEYRLAAYRAQEEKT